jgi:hypothetical protein
MAQVQTEEQLVARMGGPQEAQLEMEDLIRTMFGGVLPVVEITGNTTIDETHYGKVLQVNSATDVTLTLPKTAPKGSSFIVDQVGAGQAIFAAASGATIVNRQDFDRTAGPDALMNAYVRSNPAGITAAWVTGGDGTT